MFMYIRDKPRLQRNCEHTNLLAGQLGNKLVQISDELRGFFAMDACFIAFKTRLNLVRPLAAAMSQTMFRVFILVPSVRNGAAPVSSGQPRLSQ